MENVIAIDLGANEISVGIVDSNLNIVKVNREDVSRNNKDTLAKQIIRLIETLPYEKYEVKKVGVSACGPVTDGVMTFGGNIGIDSFDIKSTIENKFKNFQVFVMHDAQAAALLESSHGAAKDVASSLLLTLSSIGIGGSLVIQNQVIDMPCEVGHTFVRYRRDVEQVEKLCSGTGIVRLCKDNFLMINSPREFFEKVDKKDLLAEKILEEWAKTLGLLFANLQMQYNVDNFVLTGGVMNSAYKYIDQIINYANEYLKETGLPLKEISVVKAKYIQDSRLLGVATLALSYK